jgi:hypothetical protein
VKYIVSREPFCDFLDTEGTYVAGSNPGCHRLDEGYYCLETSFAAAINNLPRKNVCKREYIDMLFDAQVIILFITLPSISTGVFYSRSMLEQRSTSDIAPIRWEFSLR